MMPSIFVTYHHPHDAIRAIGKTLVVELNGNRNGFYPQIGRHETAVHFFFLTWLAFLYNCSRVLSADQSELHALNKSQNYIKNQEQFQRKLNSHFITSKII